jgi:transposase
LVLEKGEGWQPERSKPLRRQLIGSNPLLVEVIEALLKVWRSTGEQLVTLPRRVLRHAQTDETSRRLMTVPGVGAVTAAAFMATVDDPERFRRSSSVGAYFGLTPRRCQSGDIDYTGRTPSAAMGSCVPTCSKPPMCC